MNTFELNNFLLKPPLEKINLRLFLILMFSVRHCPEFNANLKEIKQVKLSAD